MMTIAGTVREQLKDWTGRWCWAGSTMYPRNTYAYFRKVVQLPTLPTRAIVRISADARYTLYVNGNRVHFGPARCYQQWQSYDTLDLTGLFQTGTNVIAVIAHQFGQSTFQSVFRDASGLLVDGVIEMDIGTVGLHTPDGWLGRPAAGWRKDTAKCALQLHYQEHFDADADPTDWMLPSFVAQEEDGWNPADNLGPVGRHPWLLMESRGVPLLADHIENFTAVVGQFRGENPRGYKIVKDVYHLNDETKFKKDNDALEDPSAMLADDDTVTTVQPPPEGEFIAVTLDLGTYRSGHFMLDIADAAGDEIIDVLFCENLEKSQVPQLIVKQNSSAESQALRYRCRPGAQKWESFHFIGMRYVLVIFRNVESKPLTVRRLAVRHVHTTLDDVGRFECSDEKLTAIWNIGRHTQLNCSFDAFVDCPWREMAMWWGDSRVQSKVALFAYGDCSLLERGIRLIARSQTADGALHAHAPSDRPNHRLPDFMLTWVGTIHDHYFQTGRTDLITECLPTLHRLFEFFESHESPDGLIGSFDGYWMFLDWQNVFKGDFSAPFNLMYLQALRWAGELCRKAGDVESAVKYDRRAVSVQSSIEKFFWDEKSSRWFDGFDASTNKPVEQFSQHTSTLAILLGLKPESHEAISREVLLKSATTKRTKILTASPFFYAYVLQAMTMNGLKAESINIIRDKWGAYVDAGATTFPEMWTVTTESRCHAWSSSPVYHLMQILLGITQQEPNWKRVSIEPFLADLEFARGVVPTPHGPIRIDWEKAGEDQLAVRIDVPEGIVAEFVSPTGEKRELEVGGNEFHT